MMATQDCRPSSASVESHNASASLDAGGVALASLDAARRRLLETPWGMDGSPVPDTWRILLAIADPSVFLSPPTGLDDPVFAAQYEAFITGQAATRHVIFEAGRRACAGGGLTPAESLFALGLAEGLKGLPCRS